VLVAGTELGFADVDVVANNGDLRRVDQDHIPLRIGRTLLIPFRIEQGALRASLRLVKHVVNDNGRTAVATDFTLTATGPTPISGAGQVTSGPGFVRDLHTLSETGPAGYTPSPGPAPAGRPIREPDHTGSGGLRVCEITNDDVPIPPTSPRLPTPCGSKATRGTISARVAPTSTHRRTPSSR